MSKESHSDAGASRSLTTLTFEEEIELLREVLRFLEEQHAKFQYAYQNKQPASTEWQLSKTPSKTAKDIEKRVKLRQAWMIALTDLVKECGLCFFDTDSGKFWVQYHTWRKEGLLPEPFLVVETSKTFIVDGKEVRGIHGWHFLAKGHGIASKERSLEINGKQMEAAGYGNGEFFNWGRNGIGPYSTIGGYRRRILHFNPKATTPLPKEMCELLNKAQAKKPSSGGVGGSWGTGKGKRGRGRPRKSTKLLPSQNKNTKNKRRPALERAALALYDPRWQFDEKTRRNMLSHYDKCNNEPPLFEGNREEELKKLADWCNERFADEAQSAKEFEVAARAEEDFYEETKTQFYTPSASPAQTLGLRLKLCGYEISYNVREGAACTKKIKDGKLTTIDDNIEASIRDMIITKTLPMPAMKNDGGLSITQDQTVLRTLRVDLTALAYRNHYDPVKQLFEGWWEEWGDDELGTDEKNTEFWMEAAEKLFDFEIPRGLDQKVFAIGLKYTVLGMVWRTMVPGCEFPLMPVWCGETGIGKSTLITLLAIKTEWRSQKLPIDAPTPERMAEQMGPYLLIEDKESQGIKKSGPDRWRAYLDQEYIRHRGAYARLPEAKKLRSVAVATSNSKHIIQPVDGQVKPDRRLLCCWLIGKYGLDVPKNGKHVTNVMLKDGLRDAMFRRALSLYHAGVMPRLSSEETKTVMDASMSYAIAMLPTHQMPHRKDLDDDVGEAEFEGLQ